MQILGGIVHSTYPEQYISGICVGTQLLWIPDPGSSAESTGEIRQNFYFSVPVTLCKIWAEYLCEMERLGAISIYKSSVQHRGEERQKKMMILLILLNNSHFLFTYSLIHSYKKSQGHVPVGIGKKKIKIRKSYS